MWLVPWCLKQLLAIMDVIIKRRIFLFPIEKAFWTKSAVLCVFFYFIADIDSRNDIAEKLGFEIISEQTINECKATAVLYKHKKTGAEIMSVSNDDENKVFGIVFRTPP